MDNLMPNYTWTYARTWLSDNTATPSPLPAAAVPAPAPKKRIGKYTRRVAKARVNRIARRLLRD